MSYLVLARKWRPGSFEDVVGQEHVTRTLTNAIKSERVAHAYLFTGSRGVGKTSAARIFAKALNCEKGPTPEPCNDCLICREISGGSSVDVHEIDGASNTSVEDIRDLKEGINYLPSSCRKKIYIIDEVHMLSNNAFNALLKTLEEPPAHVVFIFATTEPHKIPGTILSRCQRFDFKRIPVKLIYGRLKEIARDEGVSVSDRGLMMIAREADGGMRDAQSLLDQVISFAGEKISDEDLIDVLGVIDRALIHETAEAVISRDGRRVIEIIDRLFSYGWDVKEFGRELLEYFRNLAVVKATYADPSLVDATPDEMEMMKRAADPLSAGDLHLYFDMMAKGMEDVMRSFHPKISLEMLLLKMATLGSLRNIEELIGALGGASGGGVDIPLKSASGSVAEGHGSGDVLARDPIDSYDVPLPPEPTSAPDDFDPAPDSGPATPLAGRKGDWRGFVCFVKGKNIRLGSILENAHLESFDDESARVAFADAFSLARMKDGDTPDIVSAFGEEYFGKKKVFHFEELAKDVTEVKSVYEENKKLESDRSRKLKKEAREHPMVNESLSVFGGAIEEIRTNLNFND